MASVEAHADVPSDVPSDVPAHAPSEAHAQTLTVHVVASPGPRQTVAVTLSLPVGSTVADAVRRSGLLIDHPALRELATQPDAGQGVIGALTVAVWGRAAPPEHVLDDGDRIELVRPLKVDPKEARRMRYEVQGDRGRVRRKAGSLKP